jgi:ribosome-associated toxin RatA of RatAB toxin-antitoxin module
MPKLEGRATVVIEAPMEHVFEVAADAERAPDWQPEIKRAKAVEFHPDGRQALVDTETDAKVRTLKSRVRFDYDAPHRIHWVQEKGDLSGIEGSWTFKAVGEAATEATCAMSIDLGRVLGMAIRGPLAGMLRSQLIETMPEKLKRHVEAVGG